MCIFLHVILCRYIEEQKKEIKNLKCKKQFHSKVPWYDLYKGMVHEIIDKSSEKDKIQICITPEEYEKLCLPKKKVIKKPCLKKLNNKEKNNEQTRRSFRITPLNRKARVVENVEDICSVTVRYLNKKPTGRCLGTSSSG